MSEDTKVSSPYAWLGTASASTLLVLAIVGYLGGFWVSGAQYKQTQQDLNGRIAEVKVERDEWKKLALDGLKTAEDAKRIRVAALPTPSEVTPQAVRDRLTKVQGFQP